MYNESGVRGSKNLLEPRGREENGEGVVVLTHVFVLDWFLFRVFPSNMWATPESQKGFSLIDFVCGT